jgi:hypothetical protein
MRAGGAAHATRNIAAEVLRSWIVVLAVPMGAITVFEITQLGWQACFRMGLVIQVLVFGSFVVNRLPSNRLLMTLPQTRQQAEATIWAIGFAMPVLFVAVVLGSAAAWFGWHGRRIWPALPMTLDGAGLQGIFVIAWSFWPDASGRIGWPGWTRRTATCLSGALCVAGMALVVMAEFLPRHDASGALALAMAAGLPAALFVCVRRDILLKRHMAPAKGAATAPGRAHGWLAFMPVLLPWILINVAGAVLVPAALILSKKGLAGLHPIMMMAPFMVSYTAPMFLMRGLRVIRLLPISATTVAIVLMAAVAIGPCATCLYLAAAAGGTALTYASWIMPAAVLSLFFMPIALRFELLWLIAVLNVVLVVSFPLGPGGFSHGALPRLPLAGDLVACVAAAAVCFYWLRWEIAGARGIQLRAGVSQ